jgi:hypothetical protein
MHEATDEQVYLSVQMQTTISSKKLRPETFGVPVWWNRPDRHATVKGTGFTSRWHVPTPVRAGLAGLAGAAGSDHIGLAE